MHFYTLTDISTFIDNTRVDAYDADMFHGFGEREGKRWPHQPRAWATTTHPSVLEITRSGRSMPNVFQPGRNLVVSESIAAQLRQLPNMRMLPVVFKRIVDFDIAAVRAENVDDSSIRVDAYEDLMPLPDSPELRARCGPYFEVLCWRLKDLVEGRDDTREVVIETMSPQHGRIDVCDSVLNDYPIMWGEEMIINDAAMSILRPHIDEEFFVIREYTV